MSVVPLSVKLGRASEHSVSRSAPDRLLYQAILQTVAYTDIFDYPLTATEIQRYLVGCSAALDVVHGALEQSALVPARLSHRDGYYMLPGREAIVETRRRRARTAAQMWPQALRYGHLIAQMPFVRMVSVTGALAVDNVEPDADIDYMVITEPGRLWLCRALVIALVRVAALRGDIVCPNYFLSDRVLAIRECNLYTARELAQMVPVAGMSTYQRLRRINNWTAEYLPNADGPPRRYDRGNSGAHTVRLLAEAALRSELGGHLERWEMERKVRKFSRQHPGPAETAFCPDWCKGHFDSHGQKTLTAFQPRLDRLDM